MSLKLYNTMNARKEDFVPLREGKVGMYVCGVTVYDYCHIGHARAAVVFDVLYRYLLHKGYDVIYVRNFTDVDDKIIERANREGKNYKEIAEFFIKAFYEDMNPLNLLKPTYEPKATDHIGDMIEAIKKLIEKGYAYEVDGDVYFSVEKFTGYGKLSGKRLEDLIAGFRVEVDEKKRHPFDFALWKKSKPGEPSWDSPWGPGRPGWHIECSVMSMKYIGETLDIHGGGKDLVFPHHENEIAQSEAITGKTFARYWVHNGFVTFKGDKMSKSLGNILNLRDIYKEFHPEALRLFILSTHYRNPIDFSLEGLRNAEISAERVYTSLQNLNILLDKAREEGLNDRLFKDDFVEEMESIKDAFYSAMDDDLNTAKALASFYDAIRLVNRLVDLCSSRKKRSKFRDLVERIVYIKKILQNFSFVLAVFGENPRTFLNNLYERRLKKRGIDRRWLDEMIERRALLRREKKFDEADRIREELHQRGIILEDTPEGTRWRVEP